MRGFEVREPPATPAPGGISGPRDPLKYSSAVRDLMGHADISTTARYLSSTDQRKRDAVAALMADTRGHSS